MIEGSPWGVTPVVWGWLAAGWMPYFAERNRVRRAVRWAREQRRPTGYVSEIGNLVPAWLAAILGDCRGAFVGPTPRLAYLMPAAAMR